jgi:hypothetical protein
MSTFNSYIYSFNCPGKNHELGICPHIPIIVNQEDKVEIKKNILNNDGTKSNSGGMSNKG